MKETFYHLGGIGDIIYSLPTVQKMGGGTYITGLPIGAHNALKPLLLHQDCIDEVLHVSETAIPQGFKNLDYFPRPGRASQKHLVNLHLAYWNFPFYNFSSGGWLTAPNPYPVDTPMEEYAVINITPRYRDKIFNWEKEIAFLCKQVSYVYFIGLKEEFIAFHDRQQGKGFPYSYYPTSNLLTAAVLIKGAKLFSGNQSSMMAIRQGLGQPYRMEQSPHTQDCNQYSDRETIINPRTRKLHFAYVAMKQLFMEKKMA